MTYAVTKNGVFTGTCYAETSDRIEQFHAGQGEKIAIVESVVELDGGGFDGVISHDSQRETLKQARDKYIARPIKNVQVDTVESRENIRGAADNFDTLYPDGVAFWIGADNSVLSLKKSDLDEIISVYATRKKEAFVHYTTLLAELATAEKPGDIVWTLNT